MEVRRLLLVGNAQVVGAAVTGQMEATQRLTKAGLVVVAAVGLSRVQQQPMVAVVVVDHSVRVDRVVPVAVVRDRLGITLVEMAQSSALVAAVAV